MTKSLNIPITEEQSEMLRGLKEEFSTSRAALIRNYLDWLKKGNTPIGYYREFVVTASSKSGTGISCTSPNYEEERKDERG